ncbi:MAG: hypothetical protein ACP5Q5_04195 [Brevinematia bacterium]
MEDIVGHKKLTNIIDKIIENKITGRAIIIEGKRGVGKFTLALKLAEKILGKNPFLSNNFLFYRNDDFLLKTQFFLKYLKDGSKELKIVNNYFLYLFSRTLKAIEFGEISNFKVGSFDGKNKVELSQFIYDITLEITNGKDIDFLPYSEVLLKISEEISKKKVIPINFVREWKDFNNIKSIDDKKIVVVGDFEDATIEAQNSALKVIEEPQENTLIILTSSDINGILATILSRCLVFKAGNLKPEELSEIFKISFVHDKTNTLDFMKDYIFYYNRKIKEKVEYFFENVAPEVQKNGNLLFQFSEELLKEGREFVISFFEEIISVLNELHLKRQFYLRKNENETNKYNFLQKIHSKTYVSEIHSIGLELVEIIQKFKTNENLSLNLIIIDLFIKISRWYQRMLLRKKIL